VIASPSVKALIEEATHAADWVLVDTAPILVAGESAPLFEGADLVLVVAKAESISSPVAERTRDTLHRVGADNAWVVLNHARESIVPGGYRHYQHEYRVVAEREARRERRLSRKGFLG
jgi:Mrp family chromosome partitioning ATPase